MSRASAIARLEASRAEKELEVAEAVAELRGIDAQLASLRTGVTAKGNLISLPRTDAILQVLHSAGAMLSPTEIMSHLNSAGRDDDRRSVTATLNYLLNQDLVLRPAKGLYLAV